MALVPGSRLGPYEIVAAVGAGGMGEVYRARDTRLDRTVAVKILSAALAVDPQFRERFDREARAVSQLSHPHICTLHDVGEERGTAFLVMEFLDGETLASRLKKGPMPLGDALDVASQIAEALAAAHEAGVIHRDLKPGNVMLTKGGAKLLDFGLAKTGMPAASPGVSILPTTPANLTAQGAILGTLQYMSPEQLEGEEADARSDIFAFGSVLYEMVTGRKAFEGKSQASLINAIMSASPAPISQVTPIAPALLDHLVRTCLARDPAHRVQTARDVLIALRWVRDADTASAGRPPARVPASRAIVAAIVTCAVAAAAAAGYLASSNRPAARPIVRFDVFPPEGARFTLTHALSPDGRQIVATVTDSRGASSLWLRRLDEDAGRTIPGTDGATFPFWSPDSQLIGFFADQKLKRLDTRAGSPIAIADAPAARGGAWTADGWIIFAPSNNDPLMRVPAAGGDPTPFTRVATERGESGHRFPFVLSQGRFGYYAMNRNAAENGVWVAPLAAPSSATRAVRSDATGQFGGDFIFFMRDDGLVAQRLGPRSSRLTGEPITVADGLGPPANLTARPMSVSSDGSITFQRDAKASMEMVWLSRTGERIGAPLVENVTSGPALSDDGSRIAFVKDQRGQGELWVMDTTRQTATTITRAAGLTVPRWSPDSQRIAFAAAIGPGGNVNVYDVPAAGGSRHVMVPEALSAMRPVGWTRGGQQFIWAQTDIAPQTAVKTMGSDGQIKTVLETVGLGDPRLSNDDRWIAYTSSQSGTPEVYVIGFPDAGPPHQVSTTGGTRPRWRRDGRELFYLSADGKLMSVDVRAQRDGLELGKPTVLFTLPVPESFQYDAAPDGMRFIVNSARQSVSAPLTVVLNWAAGQTRR